MSRESDATVELQFRQMTARTERINAAFWRNIQAHKNDPDIGFRALDRRGQDAFLAGVEVGHDAYVAALQEVGE